MSKEYDELMWKMELVVWERFSLDELIKINTLLKEIEIARANDGDNRAEKE